MNEARYAYLAGLMEGEGSFTIKTGTRGILIGMQLTDLDVLESLRDFGGTVNGPYNRGPAHWKPIWRWTLSGDAAYDLTLKLLPYLGKRRTGQANEMLATHRDRRQEEVAAEQALQERTLAIKKLRTENGWTHQHIADHMGVDRTTVSHTLRGRFDRAG